ncbi:MAG: hypothetical protein GWP08_13075 [Nitrospiraceae bacterium]|nr:hypothetical protein [Nitrospiraceae bacterium]
MAQGIAPSSAPIAKDGEAADAQFKHEVWGRTYYGDGYAYGPTLWRSSVSVVDIDNDGDNDFAFRAHYTEPAVVMRNLGTSGAFYPGGMQELNISNPDADIKLDVISDFGDLTGDGLPDLVVLANQFSPNVTKILWYTNTGSGFTYGGPIYTSPQSTLPEMAFNLADINNDGLLDLFFMEPFLEAASDRQHRVYQMLNTGSSSSPAWSPPVEVRALSDLMPPRMVDKAAKSGADTAGRDLDTRTHAPKASYSVRVADIEVVDWDVDGRLDFMFYDAEHGIDFVRNTGTAESPEWGDELNPSPAPIPWRHNDLAGFNIPAGSHDDFDVVYGSFAVRTNSAAYLPDAKWLDDFYIAMDGWLITLRYDVEENAYRLIQENSVEFGTGQGPAGFWDYDGDGDLDLFRTGIGSGDYGSLLLFPNIGTVYSPAWGALTAVPSMSLHKGTPANYYRQDLFTFTDYDYDDAMDFFVQGQDGAVDRYAAIEPIAKNGLPSFSLQEADFGAIVLGGQTDVTPRGLAVARFNDYEGSSQQMIAAYGSGEDGKIVYYDPLADTFFDISVGVLLAPDFLTSYGDGDSLWPNLIEGLATSDVDRDGRPDLVVTVSEDNNYYTCVHLVYRNVKTEASFAFARLGYIKAPSVADPKGARMLSFADIDADDDEDLFIGHQVYSASAGIRRNYLRFYRNDGDTGLAYWRTRVVSGQEWPISWKGELPYYGWILNASGGGLTNPGRYLAGSNSSVVDIIQSTGLAKDVRVFIDVLPPVGADESKAIIIVGGDPADSLYGTFNALGAFAYWVLLTEGLDPGSIRFFTARTSTDVDDDGTPDVYAAPTLAGVHNSVTSWAPVPDRLLVFMLDHGQRNRFRLNASEYLEASTYASWLDTLQAGGGPLVTTIIDTCEAGSFIDNLALSKDAQKAGIERITMTSSGVGATKGIALFDRSQYLSFSLGFWQQVFNGSTYGQAFESAAIAINSINPLQVPQIDDDGDGKPNEANDGFLADTTRPGADFEFPGSGVFIGEVAPPQATATNSAIIWLADVVTSFPVEAAGALVVPPNFQRPSLNGDDEQPVTGLDWISLTYNAAQDRWQAQYSGFTEGGLYRVQYYVKAGGRYHASPRIGFVDRIGTPDAWESDNSAGSAQWIPINSVQGHNFHVSGDTDWVRFTSPHNESATIAVISPAYRNRPVVQLYRASDLEANPSAAPVKEVIAAGRGDEVVFEHHFAVSDQYLVRIANNTATRFGEGTSYLLLVAVGTGGGSDLVPTTLVVSVFEQGSATPVSGANVQFDGSANFSTGADGIAQFICPSYGAYALQATKTGYVTETTTVNVNNLFESVTMNLTESGGEGEGEGEGEGGCAPGRPANTVGDFLTLALVGLVLLWRRQGASDTLSPPR